MKTGKYVLIGIFAAFVLFSGLAKATPAAHYQLISHPKEPKLRGNKIKGPFGMNYLAPKKQHPAKNRYRSPVTGNTLYGKPKR